MTRLQLQVYAAGYQKATGKDADLVEIVEIHNLEVGHIHREEVKGSIVQQTLDRVVDAGKQIRDLNLPKHEKWCDACSSCNIVGICRTKSGVVASA